VKKRGGEKRHNTVSALNLNKKKITEMLGKLVIFGCYSCENIIQVQTKVWSYHSYAPVTAWHRGKYR
jgi:hypothetical protein